jgi:hypothetical protein
MFSTEIYNSTTTLCGPRGSRCGQGFLSPALDIFIAFRPLTEDHYGAVKIWLTTDICDLVENNLPEEIAARIKWGPIITSYISPVSRCLVECDPSDRAAIIATAQQHSPDKITEIKMAIEAATTYDR